MILDEYIEIPVGSRNIKYYQNLGYVEYKKDDGKKYFNVKVDDLQHSTANKIHVSCDNEGCDNTWMQPYKNYLKIIDKYGSNYCKECQYLHNQQTCLEKYGETSYAKTQECKDKHIETYLKNYGTTSPMLNQHIKDKVAKTNMEKYGSISPFGNKDVRAKSAESLISKYGSMKNYYEHLHEEIKKQLLNKYGHEYPSQIPEIKEKIVQSYYNNSSQIASSQQLYIYNVIGGELNYPYKQYSLDIYNVDDMIDIEVDFGGHNLSVKIGTLTNDEFKKKEMIREKTIRSAGIRIIRLVSPHDKLPSDKKLLEIYDFAKQYFNSTNHTWINFYLEENKYRNAEHQNESGAFYDYGELWNAKVLSKKQKEVNNVA